MSNDVKQISYSSMHIRTGGSDDPFSTGFISHPHYTRAVAVSPDGKWIAFGGWDETIQVCELVEGGQSLTYRGHKGHVRAIVWSPDGTLIASVSGGETSADVQVWGVPGGQTVSRIQNDDGGIFSLAWSFDGISLAFGTGRSTVHLVNALKGERQYIYRIHPTDVGVSALAWSPEGSRVASGGLDGTVEVWDTSDGSNICRYLGHYGAVNALAWSPDGTFLASGGNDKTVQVWNASTREPICTCSDRSERIIVVGWSHDGLRVRCGSWDAIIREFDAHNGTFVTSFRFPVYSALKKAMSLAWNAAATVFAMGLEDRRVVVADMVMGKLWLCRAPAPPVELFGQGNKEQPEGLRASIRQGRAVKTWGSVAKEIVTYRGHIGAVKAVAWSPDNRLLASGGYDNTLQVWDASNGKPRATCHGHLDPVVAVAWSSDGHDLVSSSLDATVRRWDARTGHPISDNQGQSIAVSAVAWSPGVSAISLAAVPRIASASEDGAVQIWDMENNIAQIYHGHRGAIEAIAWSPDGHLVASGGEDRTVHIWDAITGKTICAYGGHTGAVMSVVWSPDGKRIASSSNWGLVIEGEIARVDDLARVHLWDVSTGGNPVFCDNGLSHMATPALAWSPDGQYIAAGDTTGHIYIYGAATGEALAHLFLGSLLPEPALALAWSSDGTRIAASFSHGQVLVWPAH